MGVVDDIGAINTGDYKIENTREYIYKLGKRHLEDLFNDDAFKGSKEPIYFTFTGHSRGAVGVVEGAMRLKHLVMEKYSKYADRIHFNTLLYDPVPGPKDRLTSNVNHAINLKEQTREMSDLNMAPFGENDHTTVVYSMGCNHQTCFTPMKVLGADTVILTGHSHDEGLKDIEKQANSMKRAAYINAQNGEAYRASGLMEMPKGIFISDENNVMIPAKNVRMAENVISDTYTRSDKDNNARIRRILEVCTDVHIRRGGTPTIGSVIRGFNTHDPFYVRSSKEFRTMRTEFEKLMPLLVGNNDPDKVMKSISKVRAAAQAYIELKAGKGPHSNRTQGRINTAKCLAIFLDHTTVNEMSRQFREKLNTTAKAPDLREGFLDFSRENLARNQSFMKQMCERYSNLQPVETDMFLHTLSSMMADRYFLRMKESFMPNPLLDAEAQQKEIKKLKCILGDGSNSLFEVFSKSPAVKQFAADIISGKQTEAFKDPSTGLKSLDGLLTAVSAENSPAKEKDLRNSMTNVNSKEMASKNNAPAQPDDAAQLLQ